MTLRTGIHRVILYWASATLVVGACGGDSRSEATGGQGGAGGGSAAGTTGGTTVAAGAGGQRTAGATAGAAGTAVAGATGSAGMPGACTVLDRGATGMNGLTLLYKADKITDRYQPANIDGSKVYFVSGNELLAYPIAGGEVVKLGAARGSHHVVAGGRVYYFATEGTGDTGRVLSAPLDAPATTTTLADSVADPEYVVADATALYFERRTPAAILKLPFAGGPPQELVPGGQPLGMVIKDGNLYWTDFSSDKLERVATGGGQRQPLAGVFFGGPMAAAGDSVYWADTSRKSVERWVEGTKASEVLASLSLFDSPDAIAAVGTTVYWGVEGRCGDVYAAQAGSKGATLVTVGTGEPLWMGATDKNLFILGTGGLYRSDRP